MKSKIAPYLFIAPAFLLLLAFSILPIFLAGFISLTDLKLAGLADYSRVNFIGFDNYSRILSDPIFIQALLNTLFYVVIGVPLVVLASLTVAVLINIASNKFATSMRLFFYSPSITNIVAVSLIWVFIFNPSVTVGLLNRFLAVFSLGPVAWLQDPSIAKLSLIVLAVWRAVGINMLIFSAAMANIPKSLYEAAELDGANTWTKVIRITVPQMGFALFFVVITTIIGWLQFFEEPFVMTQGGPLNSTLSAALFIYQRGFQLNNFGYAAAGSVILFILIISATVVQLRIQNRDKRQKKAVRA